MHNQVDAADIYSEFEGCCGNDGRNMTCFQTGFDAVAGFPRNAAMVSQRQFRSFIPPNLAVQLIQSPGNFLGLGLPIGWGYYPNCPVDQRGNDAVSYDSRCKAVMGGETGQTNISPSKSKPQKNKTPAIERRSTLVNVLKTGWSDPWGVLRWLFGVMITGTLIGLGGPFWFDVASKLSVVRQKIRGAKDQKETGQSGSKTLKAEPRTFETLSKILSFDPQKDKYKSVQFAYCMSGLN